MPRVSLAEQYDNKDVVQQIYLLKDGVAENAEQIAEVSEGIQQAIDDAAAALEKAEDAEQIAAQSEITGAAMSSTPQGTVSLVLTKESGQTVQADTLIPTIKSATLISGSSERTFRIHFNMADGSEYETNDFVVPSGGGTEVYVQGVEIVAGTAENSFRVAIQLSDLSYIYSNDYYFPEGQTYTLPVATAETLGGVKIGDYITAESDGTINPRITVSGSYDSGTGNLTVTVNGVGGVIPLGELSTVGFDLTVQVTNYTGSVEGVTVQATDGINTYTGITDSTGVAHIIILENGTYTISAPDEEQSTTATQSVGLSGTVSIDISGATPITGTVQIDASAWNPQLSSAINTSQSGTRTVRWVNTSETTETSLTPTTTVSEYAVSGTAINFNTLTAISDSITYDYYSNTASFVDRDDDNLEVTTSGDIANYDFALRVRIPLGQISASSTSRLTVTVIVDITKTGNTITKTYTVSSATGYATTSTTILSRMRASAPNSTPSFTALSPSS